MKLLWEVGRTVLLSAPVAITIFDTFGYVVKVEGVSMQPTFNPYWNRARSSSDFVFLNRWQARQFGDLRRGEVVTLTNPRDPRQRLVKRVVAIEGDTIRTLGYRNRYVTLGEGECWVEGDNHIGSLDSNVFGPVPTGLITGKVTAIVWPPSRIGPVETEFFRA